VNGPAALCEHVIHAVVANLVVLALAVALAVAQERDYIQVTGLRRPEQILEVPRHVHGVKRDSSFQLLGGFPRPARFLLKHIIVNELLGFLPCQCRYFLLWQLHADELAPGYVTGHLRQARVSRNGSQVIHDLKFELVHGVVIQRFAGCLWPLHSGFEFVRRNRVP